MTTQETKSTIKPIDYCINVGEASYNDLLVRVMLAIIIRALIKKSKKSFY